jgi:NAD(P)-dependent dehydrogenase (short-subunit alcohol dehydrogenase family)
MNIGKAVAIVTGAGQGLGRATALRLASQGAKVVVADINSDAVKSVVSEIGANAIGATMDVTSPEQVEEAIASAASKWGGLHMAVNCAGILAPGRTVSKRGPMNLDKFAKVLHVNVAGTFNVIRLSADMMSKNDPNEKGERGVIVNTASIAAFDGQIGQAAYAASKGAIAAMTLPIARDLASYGIRICTIAPGIFMTPMMAELTEEQCAALTANVPFPNRMGEPDEFAQMVQAIAENPMMNGETIRLDAALRMAAK